MPAEIPEPVAAAAGAETVAVVDPDTGHVEVLARLGGVTPTIDRPVSAAAVGDDPVFLARSGIWRIERTCA